MPNTLLRCALLIGFALSLGCGFSIGENGTNTSTSTSAPTSAQTACKRTCSDGCCTKDGECIAGTSASACGASGNACQACPDDQRCELSAGGGSCRPCSQLNCNGCCTSAGACLAGTENSACGYAGQTCTTCPGFCASYSTGGGRCQ